eukprot:Seg2935.2 transcript_id=Seg2935.2/GoldUCD/mRNA.D3Y31 product="hypothetical protein" pseudo=true protein_id=Seg2935.2/GoldUCD/D3Y31
MKTIAGDYGMVVISRAGSNPERFVSESDILSERKEPSLRVVPLSNWRKGLRINERKLATTVPDF